MKLDRLITEERMEKGRLQEIRTQRRNRLPDEPLDGIKVKIRHGRSWTDITRTFLPTDSLQVLCDFIGSLDDSSEHFKMSFPDRESVISSDCSGNFLDFGIRNNTLIQVTWLTEEKSSSDDMELGTPTVVTNRQRYTEIRREAEIAEAQSPIPRQRRRLHLRARLTTTTSSTANDVSTDSDSDVDLPSIESSDDSTSREENVAQQLATDQCLASDINRLLSKAIGESILCGPEGNKFFIHDGKKLEHRVYEVCGKLTAYNILNGGPGLPMINPTLYSFITDQSIHPDVEIQKFPSTEDLTCINEILNCSNNEDFQSVINNYCDVIIDQGLVPVNCKFDEKEKVVTYLMKNSLYYKNHAEISQFTRGLNEVGPYMTR